VGSIGIAVSIGIVEGAAGGVLVEGSVVSFFEDEMGVSLAEAHNSLGWYSEANLQILLHINERIVKLFKHNLSRFVPPESKSKLGLLLELKSERLNHEHL